MPKLKPWDQWTARAKMITVFATMVVSVVAAVGTGGTILAVQPWIATHDWTVQLLQARVAPLEAAVGELKLSQTEAAQQRIDLHTDLLTDRQDRLTAELYTFQKDLNDLDAVLTDQTLDTAVRQVLLRRRDMLTDQIATWRDKRRIAACEAYNLQHGTGNPCQ